MPHSQDGKKKPKKEPTRIARNLLLVRIFCTRSGVKYTCSAPEMRHPNRTKGIASMTIDKKIVLICRTECGRKLNM
jgi:hypothetical protein